jgi:hypothetical protein
LVEYINALHSCLNTTTFFSLSHPPFARSSHIRHVTFEGERKRKRLRKRRIATSKNNTLVL